MSVGDSTERQGVLGAWQFLHREVGMWSKCPFSQLVITAILVVTVNFVCQLDWVTECPDIWLNVIPDVRMFWLR